MSMAKQALERQVENWRTLSLVLLLILGIVGAVSYSLLFRQKAQLELQELRITQLSDQVGELSQELEASTETGK